MTRGGYFFGMWEMKHLTQVGAAPSAGNRKIAGAVPCPLSCGGVSTKRPVRAHSMASAAFCNVTPCSPVCSSFVDSARVLSLCTQRQFQSTTELQQVTIFRLPSVCRPCVHLRALTGYRLLSAPVCRSCVHYRATTPYKLSLAPRCRPSGTP